jgi:hypothetical protein
VPIAVSVPTAALNLVGEQALDQVKAGGEMPRELADGHSGALGDLL